MAQDYDILEPETTAEADYEVLEPEVTEQPAEGASEESGVRFRDYAVEGLKNIGSQVLGLPGELVRLPETIARAAGQASVEGLGSVPQIVQQPPSALEGATRALPISAKAIRGNRFLSQTMLGPLAEVAQELSGMTTADALGTLPAFGARSVIRGALGVAIPKVAVAGFSTQAAGAIPEAVEIYRNAPPDEKRQAGAALALTGAMALMPAGMLRNTPREGRIAIPDTEYAMRRELDYAKAQSERVAMLEREAASTVPQPQPQAPVVPEAPMVAQRPLTENQVRITAESLARSIGARLVFEKPKAKKGKQDAAATQDTAATVPVIAQPVEAGPAAAAAATEPQLRAPGDAPGGGGSQPARAGEVPLNLEALAQKAADPKAGRFTDAENAALGGLTPEARQAYLARVREIKSGSQPISPTVPGVKPKAAEPSAPVEPRPVETVGEPSKQYVYHSPLRPVASISQSLPKDWKLIDERTFSVSKPLSFKLEENLQLEPRDVGHPKNLKKAREQFSEKLQEVFVENNGAEVMMEDGQRLLLTENIDPTWKYPFRVTRVLADGTPAGHETFSDWDSASSHLHGAKGTIKAPKPKEVTPDAEVQKEVRLQGEEVAPTAEVTKAAATPAVEPAAPSQTIIPVTALEVQSQRPPKPVISQSQPVGKVTGASQKKYLISEAQKALVDAPVESRVIQSEALADLQRMESVQKSVEERIRKSGDFHDLGQKISEGVVQELTDLMQKYEVPETYQAYSGQKNLMGTWGKDPFPAGSHSAAYRIQMLKEGIDKAQFELGDNVVIEVPGDGTFVIKNTKTSIRDFLERAKKFPTTVAKLKEPSQARTTPSKPSAIETGRDLESDIDAVRTFTSSDDARKVLKYVMSDGSHLIATDGRRLIVVDRKGPGSPDNPKFFDAEGKQLDAPMSADELTSSKADWAASRKKNPKIGPYVATRFPDWTQVVPDKTQPLFKNIDTDRLFRVVKQANGILTKNHRAITIFRDDKGRIGITAGPNELGDYASDITPSSKPVMAVSGDYLLELTDTARRLGLKQVEIRGSQTDVELSPMTMEGNGVKMILMPMRMEKTGSSFTDAIKVAKASVPESASQVEPTAKPPEFTGMGGAVPSEFTGARVTTGHRNQIVDQERVAMGLQPMMAPLERKWGRVASDAAAAIDRDPALPDRLLQEQLDKPRPITDTEVFISLRQRVELDTEFQKASRDATQDYADMKAAKARGDQASYEARQAAFIDDTARANAWSGELQKWDKAFKKGGASTENARALNAMKAMMDEEYSLVSLEMQKRMDNGGRELTGAERAELVQIADSYTKTIEALSKHIESLEASALKGRMESALKQIKSDAAKAQGTPLRDKQATLEKAIVRLRQRHKESGKLENSGNLVQRIARSFVEQGITERDPLIDAVHGVLKQIDPAFTRRQTMDAISGYGDFRPLSKDQISVQLRDAKGQMQNVAKLEDMQKGVPPKKTGVERRIPSREESRLIKEVNEAKRKFQVPITDPATQLKSSLDTLKTRIQSRIFDLEDRLKNRDYTLVKRREPIIRDAEANRLQKKLDDIKVTWNDARFKDQMANWTWRQKAWDKFQNLTGLHRAFMTSFEMSAVLRQGKFYVLGHPIKGAKTTYQVSKILGKEIAALAKANPLLHPIKAIKAASEAGEAARHAIDQEILNRPMYRFYERDKLALTEHGRELSKMEETYRTRWAQKIPGVATSERLYTTFLNRLRADMYDSMVARFENKGDKGEISPEHGRSIARFVNAWTGRGDLAFMERTAGDLANIFFAPRFVASRFQVLSGHPFWKATPEVKKLIATEYGRTLAGMAIYYSVIASWLGLLGDDVEIGTKMTSTDLGKIRVGKTRIDPQAGLSQMTVLAARILSGQTRTQKGKVLALRDFLTTAGKKKQFGGPGIQSVTGDFLRTKLHPSAQLLATILTGQDAIGRKLGKDIGPADLVLQQTPITYQDLFQIMQDQGIPRGTALMMLAFFGEGVQTYETR